ncbi:Rne/Rng family ribonuclease [Fredinandcohnia sp. 179-A 10B2 NHS]|uniref:Rne/Rng family ribonuclease n=1 Tax=Fredinandcohnia sp. 179-A 10B2 NHS TaxID=3235176 RepID=UPI0039A398BA
MKKLILNVRDREKRTAVIENNKVVEINIQQPIHTEIVGNIYKGRVIDVLPGMQAAFVDIGIGKNGYIQRDQLQSFHLSALPDHEKKAKSISSFVRQGEEIIVQVTKEGSERKGPKLTGLIEFPGSSLVYSPFGNYIAVSRKMKEEAERDRWKMFGKTVLQEPEGIILRTACENKAEERIQIELDYQRRKYRSLHEKQNQVKPPSLLFDASNIVDRIVIEHRLEDIEEIIIDDSHVYRDIKERLGDNSVLVSHFNGTENIFSVYGIEREIEKAQKQVVWLENGAYLLIEQTEALTVIDVNTGKFQGKESLRDTVFKTNQAAATEIARQLRLRDISGIILIDFIDMKDKDERQKIMQALRSASKGDRNRIIIHGFTSLGILEVTRKKVRQDLSAILQVNCPTCLGTGRVASAETVAFKLERELWELRGKDLEAVWIEATKTVIDVFKGDQNVHLKRLEDALTISIYLSVISSPLHTYNIRHTGSQSDVKERIGE